MRSERQIDLICAIVGSVPRSPCRPGVMARVNERHAYVDPKDVEEINMTGARIKRRVESLYGQVSNRDRVFCRFERLIEIL